MTDSDRVLLLLDLLLDRVYSEIEASLRKRGLTPTGVSFLSADGKPTYYTELSPLWELQQFLNKLLEKGE